jgi:hypothetical protein
MNIKITVINHFTRETIIDSTVDVPNDWSVVEANHKAFSEMNPDCYVNFVCEEKNSFICSQPYNELQDEKAYDEGRMTWEEYCNKWYKGALSGCNEDDQDGMSDEEIERQIDMLLEQEWEMRDAICY